MKNLIPIVIYIVRENGITNEEMEMLASEGMMVHNRHGIFMVPLEFEVEGTDDLLGVMAPVEALQYLKDRDDVVNQIIDHAFDDLVAFMYWHQEQKTFYVKHPDGQIVPFSKYVRTKVQTDKFLEEMAWLGEALARMHDDEDPCEDCEHKEACDALNEIFAEPKKITYDIETFPHGILFTVSG